MIKLKSVFLFALIATFSSQRITGQLTLRIEIIGLKNSDGQVLLEFSNEKGKKISGFIQTIENKKCTIVDKVMNEIYAEVKKNAK